MREGGGKEGGGNRTLTRRQAGSYPLRGDLQPKGKQGHQGGKGRSKDEKVSRRKLNKSWEGGGDQRKSLRCRNVSRGREEGQSGPEEKGRGGKRKSSHTSAKTVKKEECGGDRRKKKNRSGPIRRNKGQAQVTNLMVDSSGIPPKKSAEGVASGVERYEEG